MKNFFVSHKNPVAVVLFIILAAGIFSYNKMQSSLFPEVTFPQNQSHCRKWVAARQQDDDYRDQTVGKRHQTGSRT